jgi:cytochrome c
MIVPIVATAFLLTYAHKYSWRLLADRKGLHIAIGAAASGLLLVVPLIFLANINLMLFPERWLEVEGFLSTLVLANVLPRYLHFLVASVAVTALFSMAYLGRRAFPVADEIGELDHGQLRAEFAGVVFAATGLQVIFGPLVLFTLPSQGLGWPMVLNILIGVCLAVAAMVLLWREITKPAPSLGLRYVATIVLLGGTVIFMAYGRHLYREGALAPQRAMIAEKTVLHQTASLGAQMREASGTLRVGGAELAVSPGEKVFRAVCMACHAKDERRVGPPLVEIADIYGGNPDAFIAWVKKPGRKRADYPDMPPIRMRDDQYRAVAAYVLDELFAEAEEPPAEPAG